MFIFCSSLWFICEPLNVFIHDDDELFCYIQLTEKNIEMHPIYVIIWIEEAI